MKIKLILTALLLVASILGSSLLTACSGDSYEVVMEYNGIKLTEDMYHYWVATFKRNILSSYSDARDTDAFWGQSYDDTQTVEDYFNEIIQSRIMNYLISQDLYKKNRLTLDADVKKAIKDDLNEKIEYYGSRGALNAELSNLMLDIGALENIYTWEEKHNCVYNWLYGAGGVDEVSDAELIAYYEANYACIKYIVFYTTKIKTDENGEYVYDESGQLVTEDMTEGERNQKMADVEACYEKLLSGEDFETLRKTYSEYDTSAYENGFFVSANELDIWGADIVLATQKAKAGDIYRVEEGEAIFLIQKLDLPSMDQLSELDLEQLSNLSVYATGEQYDAFFDELQKQVIVYSEVISKYKLSDVKANPYYSI